MTAVWMRTRGELRARWRSLLALALILGVAGGVVLFSVAGAPRTDSAYARLVSWVHGPDDIVSGGGFGYSRVDLHRVARFPQVTSSAPLETVVYYSTSRSDRLVAV